MTEGDLCIYDGGISKVGNNHAIPLRTEYSVHSRVSAEDVVCSRRPNNTHLCSDPVGMRVTA